MNKREILEMKAKHPLACKDGIAAVIGILMDKGAMCPKCGHGTRVTSTNWAKCKACGERVRRTEEKGKNDERSKDHNIL